MASLTVNASRDGFLRNGKPFFYFADTVWSAFSNTPIAEWEEYLDYRARQGFNALQISVLPILHDTSDTYTGLYPFAVREDGTWDFSCVNEAFYDNAERMLAMAVARGFMPALVMLWANYVPDTFFSRGRPSHVMPFEAVRPYTEYAARRFAAYEPVWLISGDTDFGSEATIAHYMEALRTVRAVSPEALATLHLNGAHVLETEAFLQPGVLDFYMYQSCHFAETQTDCYRLAEGFRTRSVQLPIVNGEPCYEGHGYGNKYGRFGAADVRRAFWWSVLAGAKAGFTYGTHGLFSWHRRGAGFTSESWSKVPYDWRTALRLPGAWDASFGAWLFETYGLHRTKPAQELLRSPYPEIRAAVSQNGEVFAVYIPYSNDVPLAIDLTAGYTVDMVDLEGRRVARPPVERTDGVGGAGPGSVIRMHDFTGDVLVVARREP